MTKTYIDHVPRRPILLQYVKCSMSANGWELVLITPSLDRQVKRSDVDSSFGCSGQRNQICVKDLPRETTAVVNKIKKFWGGSSRSCHRQVRRFPRPQLCDLYIKIAWAAEDEPEGEEAQQTEPEDKREAFRNGQIEKAGKDLVTLVGQREIRSDLILALVAPPCLFAFFLLLFGIENRFLCFS